MRTTVTIDDDLYNEAAMLADPQIEKSELFKEAIKTYIRVKSAKRLSKLGGASPCIQDIPRRSIDHDASSV
ncbi:type II toxin-antitoxin system VapB family antitoxin [Alteromonas oceanisediminis]|uniref:type II toxin-antitoxin system VapB family antitoxin n=1 Tax=Alteromonas oceanisediminis TaxID=2836180 RepID=UPI001BDAF050|nr:type II toxin-antitoxin system VapB family antitoxin [Alteromonas oceanisediminis]